MPGKRVQFDDETWHALDLLAKDRTQDFQELADEAFADLLRKHGRPTDLKTALRESVAGMEKRPPAASVKRGGGKKVAGNDAVLVVSGIGTDAEAARLICFAANCSCKSSVLVIRASPAVTNDKKPSCRRRWWSRPRGGIGWRPGPCSLGKTGLALARCRRRCYGIKSSRNSITAQPFRLMAFRDWLPESAVPGPRCRSRSRASRPGCRG
jgi:hypothetical protein